MQDEERWRELVRQVHTEATIDADAIPWRPARIVLTRGCDRRPDEAMYCERLIAAYPEAEVVDRRDIPHNRVSVEGAGQVERLANGKQTLVLGSIRSPVSENWDPEAGAGTLCTHYHAVHPAWFCCYDCAFCYLAGSPGVGMSPTVRLFTNHLDILRAMDAALDTGAGSHRSGAARGRGAIDGRRAVDGRRAGSAARQAAARGAAALPHLPPEPRPPVSFYVGKVQDGLQLDPIAGFSRVLVPFVQAQERAHLVFLTKSAAVDGVLQSVDPRAASGHVAVSWSINAPEVSRQYEWGAPSFEQRLAAARRCAETGLEVRLIFMPLLPVEGWRELYSAAVATALGSVRPARITLGAICSYPCALSHTRARLGEGDVVPALATSRHGRRLRFGLEARTEMYRHLAAEVRRLAPEVPVSLCLESEEAWLQSGLDPADCRCNCIAGSCDVTSRAGQT